MIRSRYCPRDSHGSLLRIIVLAFAAIPPCGSASARLDPGESRMESGVE